MGLEKELEKKYFCTCFSYTMCSPLSNITMTPNKHEQVLPQHAITILKQFLYWGGGGKGWDEQTCLYIGSLETRV